MKRGTPVKPYWRSCFGFLCAAWLLAGVPVHASESDRLSPFLPSHEQSQSQNSRSDEIVVGDAGRAAVQDWGIEEITFTPPLERTEISSPFGWRIHPVFRDRRFHKGVDFRAPKGTPVSTTADGVVVEVGRRGNYGKFIRVRHTALVETTYSHLSGYVPGLRPGLRVSQGQVIGYVGRTGVATGHHLYYEMLVNGQHVDPLDPPSLIPARPDGRKLVALKSLIQNDNLN